MKQSDKRLIRKVKRKARRAKGQTAIDGLRKMVHEYLLDLDKRLTSIEETVAELVKGK